MPNVPIASDLDWNVFLPKSPQKMYYRLVKPWPVCFPARRRRRVNVPQAIWVPAAPGWKTCGIAVFVRGFWWALYQLTLGSERP
ncbi:MAG: hypothetical protein ACP5MD_09860 [Verrucomicrobiia bacterium]